VLVEMQRHTPPEKDQTEVGNLQTFKYLKAELAIALYGAREQK